MKNPKRSVARATYIAVGIIAVFYALSSWAFAIGIGPSEIVAQSQEWGPDLMFVFLEQQVPVGAGRPGRGALSDQHLCRNGCLHNAAARYFFSMGRARVLPRYLGATGAQNGAPGLSRIHDADGIGSGVHHHLRHLRDRIRLRPAVPGDDDVPVADQCCRLRHGAAAVRNLNSDHALLRPGPAEPPTAGEPWHRSLPPLGWASSPC